MTAAKESVTAPCTECGETRSFIRWSDPLTGRTVDTAHGMLFTDDWVCDSCLGGTAAGDTAWALRQHR